MEHAENDLLLKVKSMPMRDRYANPTVQKNVLTNITELIKSDERTALLSLFNGDEKYDILSLSDFEYFEKLASTLPLLVGTYEGELAKEEILLLLGRFLDCKEFQKEGSLRSAWENANAFLNACDGNYDRILEKIGVEKSYQREPAIDGFWCVEKYKERSEKLILLCDLRNLRFVRPDPYHAALATEKHRSGEELSSDERSLLAMQIVYSLCMEAPEREIEIHLRADGDGQTAKDVIAYLNRRNLCGTVWFAADDTMSNDTILKLCAKSNDRLRVRPEIVLGKTDSSRNLKERLARLSAVYPLTLWRFGGVPTTAPLFAAGHMHARRVICALVAETVEDPNDALMIVQQIFS